MTYKLSHVDTTEEGILNEKWPNSSEPATGWRRFRINYRNQEGFSNIEGTIYFPSDFDPYPLLDEICDRLNSVIRRDTE